MIGDTDIQNNEGKGVAAPNQEEEVILIEERCTLEMTLALIEEEGKEEEEVLWEYMKSSTKEEGELIEKTVVEMTEEADTPEKIAVVMKTEEDTLEKTAVEVTEKRESTLSIEKETENYTER